MRTQGDDPAVPPYGTREPGAIGRLKRRADFQRVGKGRRWHGKALTLQAAPETEAAAGDFNQQAPSRIGYTLTKKVGCAVVRNRARRRLREAVRLAEHLPVRPGCDYVIVGRLEAVRLSFGALQRELASAMRAVHEAGKRQSGGDRSRRGGRFAETERAKGTAPANGIAPERTRPKP